MTVEIDGANNIVKTNTISEVTSANGVTVDGLSIKDSKLVTADSVIQTNITDQAINEAKMQISNAPTNGYVLSAQSGNTGGLTWAEAGGKLTHASQWYLTSDFTGSADPITSNLSQEITMGSSMTVASGVFTFPSTGFWYVNWHCGWFEGSANSGYLNARIRYTSNNGSSWQDRVSGTSTLQHAGIGTQAIVDTIVDITNVSNDKVAFASSVQESSTTTRGASGYPRHSYMTFMRLGDT